MGTLSVAELLHGPLELVVYSGLLGLLQWVISGSLVIGGLAKLRDPSAAAMAMADLGVIRRPTRSLGLAAGWTELSIGLAAGLRFEIASLAAVVLLFSFVVLSARALRDGKSFPCFCLGDHEEPLSKATISRAGALAGLGAVPLVASPFAPRPTMEEFLLQVSAATSLFALWMLGRDRSLKALLARSVQTVEQTK